MKCFLITCAMFLIFSATACTDRDNSVKDKSKPVKKHFNDEWLINRGDSGLTGYSDFLPADELKRVWRFKTRDSIKATAVISKGKAFFGSMDGSVYAVSLDTGRLIWEKKFEDAVSGSSLILNNMVVTGTMGGEIVALSMSDGSFLWKYKTGRKITGGGNSFLTAERGNYIVWGSYDSKVHCINERGEAVWIYDTKNFINGTPSAGRDFLFFGGCDALLHSVDVRDGRRHFAIDTGSYIASSTVMYKGVVYAGNYEGRLIAVSVKSREFLWDFQNNEGTPFFSAPAVHGKYLVAGSRDNYLYCLNRETGTELWKFKTGDKVDSSPLILRNKVVFGSEDGYVYMVSLSRGELIWKYETGAPVTAAPSTGSGYILAGCTDGSMYCFKGF